MDGLLKTRFIEKLEENCTVHADHIALISVKAGKEMTYAELWEYSGRAYNYLKQHGIGKEMVVMIAVPRGINPILALIGIWRAGAAAVMLDANYPAGRMDFIYKDAGCTLKIDAELLTQMMSCDSLPGFEETSLHDLAYIIYTSGTTGSPKGVMQEYGTLDMCIQTHYWGNRPAVDGRFALIAHLYYGVSLINLPPILYNLQTMAVIPTEIVKDQERLISCIEENQLTTLFMIPSMFKQLKRIPSTLKMVSVGGEAVKHVYSDQVEIINGYGRTESGFKISTFLIDRDYDITPIGRAEEQKTGLVIMDDEGNILPDGEYGNLCYQAPYFRGYVGQPELFEQLRLGDHIKSGDIGVIRADGKIHVVGRTDEMIKIRGNRVEPMEVEAVFQEILQVGWVGVRGITEKDRSYLCAYYVEEPKLTIEEAKALARQKLPSYMIPSFIMKIDRIPRTENGKISKKDLPLPAELYR